MTLPRFSNISFSGLGCSPDYSYAKFPFMHIMDFTDMLADNGWRSTYKCKHQEYREKLVIWFNPAKKEIGDFSSVITSDDTQLEYAVIRRSERYLHITFSTGGILNPLSKTNFDLLISHMKKYDIPVMMPLG